MDQNIAQQKKKNGVNSGSDEDYIPQKQFFPKNPQEAPNGKWSDQENDLYVKFLRAHLEKLESDQMRRASKIFMHMSRKIKSRTADQCRGHHRKLLKVCGSVEAIIVHIEAKRTVAEQRVHGVPVFVGCKCKALVWQVPIDIELIDNIW